MSATATIERPASAGSGQEGSVETLDELVRGVWAEISSHRAASCPLCERLLVPVYGAHARPIGARCAGCGTEVR